MCFGDTRTRAKDHSPEWIALQAALAQVPAEHVRIVADAIKAAGMAITEADFHRAMGLIDGASLLRRAVAGR